MAHAFVRMSGCQEGGGGAGGAHPLPQLPDIFRTILETKDIDKQTTHISKIYFNNPGNKAKIILEKNGQTAQIIYNYATGEIFNITNLGNIAPAVCTVQNMSDFSSDQILFGKTFTAETYSMLGPSYFMKFGSQYGQIYRGNTTVRGIPVEHWYSCQLIPGLSVTVDTHHYINTDFNWQTSTGSHPVPVRMERIRNGTGSHDFHQIIDYHGWMADDDSPDDIFQTPPGVICPGRINTKKLPDIPSHYSLQTEIILPWTEQTYYSRVYFDADYGLARYDTRLPKAGSFPITEIKDFHFGVTYYKNHVFKNCSIAPLRNGSMDVMSVPIQHSGTDAFLQIRNPVQFLFKDTNYAYVGTRACRRMTCDVFTSYRNDFPASVLGFNAVYFEYYFLQDMWTEYSDSGAANNKNYPLKVVARNSSGYAMDVNIFDFDAEHPDPSVFDVSDCYSESEKIKFQIHMGVPSKSDQRIALRKQVQSTLSGMLGISPLRFQNIILDTDNYNTYLTAILLDRPPAIAQFLPAHSNQVLEQPADQVIPGLISAAECTQHCIDANFTCRSFDFCPTDKHGSCRLYRVTHTQSNVSLVNNKMCDHISRTVNAEGNGINLENAYNKLNKLVLLGNLSFSVTVANEKSTAFWAADISILSGRLHSAKIPTIPQAFSYHVEVSIPAYNIISNANVWYDTRLKLARYDFRYATPVAPFWTDNPIMLIHDFNTGVAYAVDKVLGNCTMSSMSDIWVNQRLDFENNVYDNFHILKMKTPQEMIRSNVALEFVGQATVRHILCDVFEGSGEEYINGKKQFVNYKQYFMSKDWTQLSNTGYKPIRAHPVRMKVTDLETLITYSYETYDFDAPEYIDTSDWDITKCFNPEQQQTFQVSFSGHFHPYLEDKEKSFQVQAVALFASFARVSQLHFQETFLHYDRQNVYITSTMVADPSSIWTINNTDEVFISEYQSYTDLKNAIYNGWLHITIQLPHKEEYRFQATKIIDGLFSRNSGQPNLYHFTVVQLDVMHQSYDTSIEKVSVDGCSNFCLKEMSFDCESFSYCENTMTCYLSQIHLDKNDTIHLEHNKSCYAWTRNYLDRYYVMPGMVAQTKADLVIPHISTPNSCAQLCTKNTSLTCRSFDFCPSQGICEMRKSHLPDLLTSDVITQNIGCNHYSRKYVSDFQVRSQYSITGGHLFSIRNTTADNCAKLCVEYEGSKCATFQFCQDGLVCSLSATTASVTANTIVHNPICDVYQRQTYPNGSRYTAPKDYSIIEKNDSGAMAGLAFGLMIPSLAIGAGTMFLYQRFCKTRIQ
ncbi:hypothetical protein ScPMuIL_012391 [Solemya velum]